MPFKSKAEARYLFATNPKVAEEMASKTSDMKHLPEHVTKKTKVAKKKSKKTIVRHSRLGVKVG